MDDDTQPEPPPIYNRIKAFGEGAGGASQSAADRYNASVPKTYRPSGSLNGISASQYELTMGGSFGTPNGQSLDTYKVKRYFGGSKS
jgi:hypothetical protein